MRERRHTYRPVEYMGWKIVVKKNECGHFYYYLTRPGGSAAWVEGNNIPLASYSTALLYGRFDVHQRVTV